MPFKLSFIFAQGNCGWSENWYSAESTMDNAVARLVPSFWNGFFTPRANTTQCVAIRVSDAANPRNAKIYPQNKSRSSLGLPQVTQDDAPQSAMLVHVLLSGGGSRTIAIRGVSDQPYNRGAGGVFVPTGDQTLQINAWAQAVNVVGALLTRHLLPGGPSLDFPIQTVSPSDANGSGTLCAGLSLPFTFGQVVVFHRMPWNTFPGLKGTHRVVGVSTGGITVPVRFTSSLVTVATPGATCRVANYSYVKFDSFNMTDLREKKVGRPFFSPRGRRSPVRYAPR